jgi:hypothetical protein
MNVHDFFCIQQANWQPMSTQSQIFKFFYRYNHIQITMQQKNGVKSGAKTSILCLFALAFSFLKKNPKANEDEI